MNLASRVLGQLGLTDDAKRNRRLERERRHVRPKPPRLVELPRPSMATVKPYCSKDVRRRKLVDVLNRDGWVCCWCGCALMLSSVLGEDKSYWRGKGLRMATLEHLRPRAVGGSDEMSNLAAACGSCNGGREGNPRTKGSYNDVLRYGDEEWVRVGRRWVRAKTKETP